MKFGCFGTCRQLSLIKKAGFDSAELDFCELTAMDETTYAGFCQEASSSGLGLEVFSGLIPLTERFFSADFSLEYWLEHTKKGAARASRLGCTMIPFGAGKCRSIPEGYPVADAAAHIAHIVRSLCQVLMDFGILLVIEPLGPANSNYLNTLPEVADFLKLVDHPGCASMCDLRHMCRTEEPLSNIGQYKEIVRHAHIDDPRGDRRYFPGPDDGYDYLPYFQALHKAGYDGLVTVEATSIRQDFLTEAAFCAAYLRRLSEESK